jgi:type IV pilus assembly protein PilB
MSDYKDFFNGLQEAIINADTIWIFDNLLTLAVELGASDIHIEPYENYCRIRLRIDWILKEIIQYPKNIHDSIIAKFKIESWQMRPDEKRLPQDARVSARTLTNKEIDLRANTLPTVWWEKLVMRIVDKSKKIPPLEVLWIEWINNQILFRNINLPNGIILTTWPTWSWKSTTLYACLNYLNKPEVNITTYEDPVENKMDWLNHSQVRSDIWYTFAQWLRAALRQDPDIIMVWEIRDWETLETAMEAAMTWHLVFSTIHTNSAAETITRVLNMGAKPYMISWTFNLVMAQRLARRVCQHCKVEVNIKKENPELYNAALEAIGSMKKEDLIRELKLRWITQEQWNKFIKEGILYKGRWCDICEWTWYKWRVWLYEMMEYTDDIKNLLLQWKTAFEIEVYALKNWMLNLERDGVFKAIKWLTTLEEVYRLTKHKDYRKIFN